MFRSCIAGSRGEGYSIEFDTFEKKYKLTDELLGEGNFAKVQKGYTKAGNEPVAVKIIKKSKIEPKNMKQVRLEINILRKVNHPHIVKLIDSFETDDELILVLEYLSGGDIFNRILEREVSLTEEQIKEIFFEICSALQHCNERGISHRDIKPQNIMFVSKDSLHIKLVDFNIASLRKGRSNIMRSMRGSPHYVAPEIVRGLCYGRSCDYWSLGIVLYFLISDGHLPFHHDDEKVLLSQVEEATFSFEPKPLWKNVKPELIELVQNLLNRNPKNRYGFNEIMSHPWMNKAHLVVKSNKSRSKRSRRKGKLSAAQQSSAFTGFSVATFDDSGSDTTNDTYAYCV